MQIPAMRKHWESIYDWIMGKLVDSPCEFRIGGERMERIKNLDRYQKTIIILLAAMLVIFTVAYFLASSRVGFSYMGKILVPEKEDGCTVYTGKIKGQQARFTVTPENSLTFQYGEKVYGPYTAKEDPTAIPTEHTWAGDMTGVEIRKEEEVLFRGGYFLAGGSYAFFHEDGSTQMMITVTYGDGTTVDSQGNVVDEMEPSAQTILELLNGPELTNQCEWRAWFLGVFIAISTAVSILFADELFRWNLAFRIQNADRAEPSDWEMSSRYIGWTVLSIMALVIFIMGLQ